MGNIDSQKLITLLVGMTLIVFVTSFGWVNSKRPIDQYVEEINKRCPIEFGQNIFLDSVGFDGESVITQFISARLMDMTQSEFEDFKLGFIDNSRKMVDENKDLSEVLTSNNVVLKQNIVNLNNRSQNFEIVVGSK